MPGLLGSNRPVVLSNGELVKLEPGEGGTAQPLNLPVNLEYGRVSGGGAIAVGWNREGAFAASLERRTVQRLKDVRLSEFDFDLSADGTWLLWAAEDRGERAVYLRELATTETRRIGPGSHVAISADASTFAYERDGSIVVARREDPTFHLALEGSLPSLDPGGRHVAYRRGPNVFAVAAVNGSDPSTPIDAGGRILGPVQWSPDGRWQLWVIRTTRDWVAAPWSCTSRFRVVVRNVGSGVRVDYHVGCSLYPERVHWARVQADAR